MTCYEFAVPELKIMEKGTAKPCLFPSQNEAVKFETQSAETHHSRLTRYFCSCCSVCCFTFHAAYSRCPSSLSKNA